MKITKVLKHGNPRWRVNEPYGPDGKRPAVAALLARADASAPAAYNALAPDGRFAAPLKDSGGNLTWQSNPKIENKQLAPTAMS